MSNTTKLALRPFLESVETICQLLSREELLRVMLALATDLPASERPAFLSHIAAGGSTAKPTPDSEPGQVQQLLDGIDALENDIKDRVNSIEDGSYGDEYGEDEGYNYYDDDDVDTLSEDQREEFARYFTMANSIFLHGSRQEARTVYSRLLQVVTLAENSAGGWIDIGLDLREARARYCRCVYELSPGDEHLPAMLEAMAIEASSRLFEQGEARDYPMLQDVIDAQAGIMPEYGSFLAAWEKALSAKGCNNERLAGLRLEAAFMTGGVAAVADLARLWKDAQPKGYLTWCHRLKTAEDWLALTSAAREALDTLPAGEARSKAANFLIEAGEHRQDAAVILEGKRQRFASTPNALALLALAGEAKKQNAREAELAKAIAELNRQRQGQLFDKKLLALALLMAGRLEDAFALAEKEKPVGWSYSSPAGVVFAAVLSLIGGKREVPLIDKMLDEYADCWGISFHDIVRQEEITTSMPQEIRMGLTLTAPNVEDLARYYAWAQAIGEKRINHIVSNKQRGAYDRAALVLGALAEARAVHDGLNEAVSLLHDYSQTRYNRHSAFRKEVKGIINLSPLLRSVKL